jgi:isopentenyl diphosphate isomerase/L-lactate dehydrogenase-like FMN-dependent dehydrogenase
MLSMDVQKVRFNSSKSCTMSCLVFVDTGIRTGTDVLKALALGARGVFIGRPILYGLACGGHDGVRRVLEMLKRELTYDMVCCGLTSIDQINKDILYKHQ